MRCVKFVTTMPIVAGVLIAVFVAQAAIADADGRGTDDVILIKPGDTRFDTPGFDDYQAVYTSSSSKTGGFTLQARKSGDGKTLAIIDIIPMNENVIVAQRVIDLATHRLEFNSGPYFAWGPEFVVAQSDGRTMNWARVELGSGAVKSIEGAVANNGYVSEMFSPTLASLMPMPTGIKFKLPEANPRKGETVTSEFDTYEVLRTEALALPSGYSCECWVLEKTRWADKSKERIWVSRDAPFVYRRHRDVGGSREFVSDLLNFQALTE